MTKRTTANYARLEQQNQLDGKENQMPPILVPPERKSVVYTKRALQSIIVISLFLFVCKITHFREKFLHDVRINRNFLTVFYISVAGFFVNYLWMSIALKWCKPKNQRVKVDNWDKAMPLQFYSATVSLVFSVLSFIGAMWRTFQLMTFVIGTLGFMTVVEILSWLPSF